jgi:pimeloyl-ACP methyl ester carboxylesterase
VTQEQVDTVTVPALVIHSVADKGIPIALGEALYKSLPNHQRMVRVADAPHAVNITHAEQVNTALLDFLREHGS